LGQISVKGENNISVTGYQIDSSVGAMTTVAAAFVQPAGVSMTAGLGNILIWGEIDTDQTPSYGQIDTSQTPTYNDISTTQTPSYANVNN